MYTVDDLVMNFHSPTLAPLNQLGCGCIYKHNIKKLLQLAQHNNVCCVSLLHYSSDYPAGAPQRKCYTEWESKLSTGSNCRGTG